MPQTGIEPVREYKSRRILSPVRLPVPPLRHTRQIVPTPSESCASMRNIASHFVITLLANHNNLLSRNGTNRTRTYDPLLVRQMLSQLSYDPLCLSSSLAWRQNIIYSYFRWMSTLFLIFFWYFYFIDRNHVKNGLFTWFLHNLFFYIFSNFIEIFYAIKIIPLKSEWFLLWMKAHLSVHLSLEDSI